MEESTSIPPGQSLSPDTDKIQREEERERLDYQNLNRDGEYTGIINHLQRKVLASLASSSIPATHPGLP